MLKIQNEKGEVIWVFYPDICQIVDVQPVEIGCKIDILMAKNIKSVVLDIDFNHLIQQLPAKNYTPLE